MTIQELDAKLKATKKVCSGSDCIYKIEMPNGSIWTRNFKAYTLYNRVKQTILNDIPRDTVITGLATLGMDETEGREYVRTQQEQQAQQQQEQLHFNTGLFVVGGVVAAVVIIILIAS